MFGLSSSVRIAHIACYWKFILLRYTQLLSLSLSLNLSLSLSLRLQPTVSRPVWLGVNYPCEAYDQILLLSESWRLVDVGRSLWREDWSVFYNCCWPSPRQSFSGPIPVGLATIFYSLIFETSLFGAFYDSQGYGGGIRPRLHKRYTQVLKLKSNLCYERRFSRPVRLGKTPIWGLRPDLYYCQTVAGLLIGALCQCPPVTTPERNE
jgi:hypothetical protein